MQVTRSDAVWGGSAAALISFEVWAARQADQEQTLSRFIRRWFRVHRKAGAAIFLAGWYGFAGWVGWHIAIEGRPWR